MSRIQDSIKRVTDEVQTQADLISQIKTVLENKSSGEGGGEGGGVTLPTLTNPGSASDLAEGKELINAYGAKVTGTLPTVTEGNEESYNGSVEKNGNNIEMYANIDSDVLLKKNSSIRIATSSNNFGNATASQVAKGVTFTSASGLKITGTGSIGGNGGSYSYPEGAFAPATEFSDGKEYALVALIDGSYRYVNTTTYNDYTMNAT